MPDFQKLIDAWHAEHFADGPVARVEAFAVHVREAKDDLVEKLTAEMHTAESAIETVETWFVERFHSTIVSANTEIYNVVHAAKEALKARLSD